MRAVTAISGKVTFAATSYSFTAALDAAGHADVSIPRTGKPTPAPLLLSLQAAVARGQVAALAERCPRHSNGRSREQRPSGR